MAKDNIVITCDHKGCTGVAKIRMLENIPPKTKGVGPVAVWFYYTREFVFKDEYGVDVFRSSFDADRTRLDAGPLQRISLRRLRVSDGTVPRVSRETVPRVS